MKNNLISKTFLWMCFGLLVTFATGYLTSTSEVMLENIFLNSWTYIILIMVELVLVIVLSARVMKMKPATAKVCFLFYSFVSGLTFASIFVVFEVSSIILVFLVTAVFFALLSLIGYVTKIDLTKIGIYLFFGLLAVVIVSLINIFIGSSTLELILSIIIIAIFIGYTIYDVQRIKYLENSGLPEDNLAIYGALELYLDFINLFLRLLQIFGRSDDWWIQV